MHQCADDELEGQNTQKPLLQNTAFLYAPPQKIYKLILFVVNHTKPLSKGVLLLKPYRNAN